MSTTSQPKHPYTTSIPVTQPTDYTPCCEKEKVCPANAFKVALDFSAGSGTPVNVDELPAGLVAGDIMWFNMGCYYFGPVEVTTVGTPNVLTYNGSTTGIVPACTSFIKTTNTCTNSAYTFDTALDFTTAQDIVFDWSANPLVKLGMILDFASGETVQLTNVAGINQVKLIAAAGHAPTIDACDAFSIRSTTCNTGRC